ncbi:NAD(P)-dependent dehydrogenase (short-subunit alcohol dehydrogenase family) [Pelomonas saccharophila]|uniref:NAD(P)-dependent dehydrogenase (Short-subunit alcohol dehydrogenase family) n=1 Tax=Roseateles saccharophilus TaxID=304 RepID=A0ABU1YPJ5_ROSSA|nr:SDR family oxidoreductase [Roseateles saccharophilus]MDR7270774.1 NAD(P)-dependent dehydrogenase (short-subunit alcohol dehydrogenase family) [Roseateles saccharophilus]
MSKQVILVTGASSGIGKLSALALATAGHTVYASMRGVTAKNVAKARELRDWSFARGLDLRVVELDVLSQASADAAVATIVAEQGQLDVVVHNAGHLVVGPTEAYTPEEITAVFDTNVLGAQRVNRAALPVLREQQRGLLLWIGSTTTRGGFPPFLGPYAAAKAAMDSLAVSMSWELARFGIETSIVVPGAFTSGTDHFADAGKPADDAKTAVYARYAGLMDRIGARLTALMPPEADPQAVADEVVRVVGLAHGQRPFRCVVDFMDDGAAAVTEVAERVREGFAERIGIADLLKPTLA